MVFKFNTDSFLPSLFSGRASTPAINIKKYRYRVSGIFTLSDMPCESPGEQKNTVYLPTFYLEYSTTGSVM